jgi:probable F420-dependent oxidoreductase
MAVDVGRTGIWAASRIWPADPGAAAEAAAELEELGYQVLWLGMSNASLEMPERLLGATSSMAVATGILTVWEATPAEVAAAYHRVAGRFPGRFLLGLGASHAHVVARFGQEYRRPYSKVAQFLDGLDAATPPVPPGGRAVAALGPKMLSLAGQRSAGAHPYLVTPAHTRQARELLGPGPLLAPEQMVIPTTDAVEARQTARASLDMYLKAPNYIASLRRLGFTEEDISQASDHLLDALVAWGTPEAIAARVAEHHDAGADHVCVQVLTGEMSAKVLAGEPALPRAGWRELAPALVPGAP